MLLFIIPVVYAMFGLLYAQSLDSMIAFLFVAGSSLPLLQIKPNINLDKYFLKKTSINILIILALVVGMLNIFVVVESTGNSIAAVIDLDGIAKVAIQSTINRYEVDTDANSGNPVFLALSLTMVFIIKLCDRGVLKTSIALLPILAYSILTTEKWPSFLGVIFLIAGNILAQKSNKEINNLKIFLLLTLISVVMLFTLMLRSGSDAPSELLATFGNYLFAQYHGLGNWLSKELNNELKYGAMSFMGPLNQIGLNKREAGAGLESYVLFGMESNIYTAYRYLIMDFGLFGVLIINIIWLVLHCLLKKIRAFKADSALYAFLLFASLLSLNVTPFIHNSTALAITLGSIFIYVIQKRKIINESA